MRKIRLDIEDLAVESFGTAERDGNEDGTVHGHDYTDYEGCGSDGSRCATCGLGGGCPADTNTCFVSCNAWTGTGGPCIDPYC